MTLPHKRPDPDQLPSPAHEFRLTTDDGKAVANGREARDQELFDRIAAKYARKDLVASSRIARKQRLLRTLAAVPVGLDAALLEAGCGAGFSVPYLRGRYREFKGLDYSANLIHYAQAHNASDGVSFEVANIKEYRPPRQFDVVFMIGVLHHMTDMAAAMENMIHWLKPGGWLAANEPHPGNPLVRAARVVRTRLDGGYSDEQEELSARQLRELFDNSGLTDVRILPQGVFSTPFAEVVLKPEFIARPLSSVACAVDTLLEKTCGPALRFASWNLIALGRRPAAQ